MSRSHDAESRAAGGDDVSPGEEVLEVGRHRRAPRWLWAFATVGLAALVAGIAVDRELSHHQGRGATGASSASRSGLHALPVGGPHGSPPHVGTGVVLDAVVSGWHTWVLHANRNNGLSIAIGHDTTVPLPKRDGSAMNGTWRLVLDATADRLWAVLEGTRHGRALEYRLWTLTFVRELALPSVDGAAAMDGHLYMTSDKRLIDVGPRAAIHAIPVPGVRGAPGTLGPITADPARSRVLLLDYSARTHIWIYHPDRNRIRLASALPVTKASIAVTDHAIWIGGFGRTGAILWRLTDGSLRRQRVSPLGGELGPGAVLLGGGAQDVWVGSGGGPGLWCVDGRTGTREQHWGLTPTAVTTDRRRTLAVADGRAVQLNLRGGCTG